MAEEERVLVLRGMRVEDAYQRQGIGRQLLHEFANVLGGRECYCVPNTHLIDFYEEIGFRQIDQVVAPSFLRARMDDYLAGGFDVVLMHREGS